MVLGDVRCGVQFRVFDVFSSQAWWSCRLLITQPLSPEWFYSMGGFYSSTILLAATSLGAASVQSQEPLDALEELELLVKSCQARACGAKYKEGLSIADPAGYGEVV